RGAGAWTPAESGLVVKILGVTNGLAALDTNGDGLAESPATLAALSITDDERQQLASLYPSGQTLWRVLIPHFDDAWDVNWGFGPPDGSEPPDDDPLIPELLDDSCPQTGNSVIECQNQVLGEATEI